MSADTNRLSALFESDPPAKRVATPAQVEAARRNGARSRGPKTAAGKARSAANALRHGLLAKRLAPYRNDCGERDDYEAQLRGLVEEFQPRTRTEQNLCELLAGDYLKLQRARQFTEAVMDPGPLPHPPTGLDLGWCRRRADIARDLLDRFDDDRPFQLSEGEINEVADLLKDVVDELAEDAADCRRARKEDDGFVHPGTAERAALYRRIGPRAIGAGSQGRLRRTLADDEPIRPEHRDRWRLLLERLVEVRDSRVADALRYREECEFKFRRHQASAASRLPALSLLGEYEHRIRREIERTTAMLLGLTSRRRVEADSGSFIENAPGDVASDQ